MKIIKISIEGLFGFSDHVIPLNIKDRITILYGSNGIGKSIILRMLDGLLNSKHSVFSNIPFDTFKVYFDDQSILEVEKENENIIVNYYRDDLEKASLDEFYRKNNIKIRLVESQSSLSNKDRVSAKELTKLMQDKFADGSKIELLKTIVNSKLVCSYKEINFSKEQGFVITIDYPGLKAKTISLTDLSSGEQHLLVLLCELLFKAEPQTLFLIDEPESSLHVAWRSQFLKDLQEIIKLANLDIILATHSPDIIQDRWDDLTVELS